MMGSRKARVSVHIQIVMSLKAKRKKMKKPLSSLETLMAPLGEPLQGPLEKSVNLALPGLVPDSETGKGKANPGRLAVCCENAQMGVVFHVTT